MFLLVTLGGDGDYHRWGLALIDRGSGFFSFAF
jgi:hypothetical protein